MFKAVKVRKLSEEEIRGLDKTSLVYITEDEFEDKEDGRPVLVMGCVTSPEADGGYVPVMDVFGVGGQRSLKHHGIYVEDDKGEPAFVIREAGSHFDLSLIFPKIAAQEVKDRVFEALRKEFGEGVIGIVQANVRPVSAVKYDVHEQVTVATGRGATRKVDTVLNLLAEDVYHPQAMTIRPQNGGQIVIGIHKPKTRQMPTI